MNIEKIETFKYYESFNGSYGVKLPDQELEYIHSLCMNSYPYETGGILIGRYSDDLKWAEITTITGAPAESKQTLCSFVRRQDSRLSAEEVRRLSSAYFLAGGGTR